MYSEKNEFPLFFKLNKIKGGFVDIKVYISKLCQTPGPHNHNYKFEMVDNTIGKEIKVRFSNCFEEFFAYVGIYTKEPLY